MLIIQLLQRTIHRKHMFMNNIHCPKKNFNNSETIEAVNITLHQCHKNLSTHVLQKKIETITSPRTGHRTLSYMEVVISQEHKSKQSVITHSKIILFFCSFYIIFGTLKDSFVHIR